MRRNFAWICIPILLISACCTADTFTLSAAISLKETLAEIGKLYQHQTGNHVKINVGASGQLMDQIRNGAPVDLFVSAGVSQVDELDAAGLTLPATRHILARNRLVLIIPAGRTGITRFEDLANDAIKRIAVGKPAAVPAGDYAMEVFDHLKITDQLKGKLVYGANVRQVLDYVRRAEVDAGIVYATDAIEAGDKVRVVAVAPEGSHREIEYVGVLVKGANPNAAGFLEFLLEVDAQKTLKMHGFEAVKPAATQPSK